MHSLPISPPPVKHFCLRIQAFVLSESPCVTTPCSLLLYLLSHQTQDLKYCPPPPPPPYSSLVYEEGTDTRTHILEESLLKLLGNQGFSEEKNVHTSPCPMGIQVSSNQNAATLLKDQMPSYLQSFPLTCSQSKVAHTCMYTPTHFPSNPSFSPDLLPCFISGNLSVHFAGGFTSLSSSQFGLSRN